MTSSSGASAAPTTRFTRWAPSAPPVTYVSGRAGSRPKRANARSRRPAWSSGRIGLPVTTTFPAGKAEADAAKVTATWSASRPISRFASPGTTTCSWTRSGRRRTAAATAVGTATNPPVATTTSGRSRPRSASARPKPAGTRSVRSVTLRHASWRRSLPVGIAWYGMPAAGTHVASMPAWLPIQASRTPSPSRARSALARARPADGVASGAASSQDDRHGPPREACRLVPAGSARLLHPARSRGAPGWPAAASGHGARRRARSGGPRARGRGGRSPPRAAGRPRSG